MTPKQKTPLRLLRQTKSLVRNACALLLVWIASTAWGATLEEVLQEKFQDTLLVIHYNHPYYDSIPFLRGIYGDIFPNIVFYGEMADPQVTPIPTKHGYTFIRVVEDVLIHYPSFEGYLFLQDDCFLQFWNFAECDGDKIWYNPTQSADFQKAPATANSNAGWFWWNTEWGLKALRKVYPLLTAQDFIMLARNHGPNCVVGAVCDMFYIPKRLASKTLRLAPLFRDVFCEIAVPTLLSCIEELQQWQHLSQLWAIPPIAFEQCEPSLHWIHPLKFSAQSNRDFVLQQIETHYTQKKSEQLQ
jgi:hypothetical protein